MKKIIFSLLIFVLLASNFSDSTEANTKDGVIAFGDSNTSGSYLGKQFPGYADYNWPKLVGATNAGISGYTTAGAMKRFKNEVLDKNPSTVVVMFGINDALIRPDTKQPQVSKLQFEKNLTSMVSQLKSKKSKVILMTNLPVNETVYYNIQSKNNPLIKLLYADKGGIRDWENSYNNIIRKVAKAQKVTLIDNYANAINKAGGSSDSLLTKSGLIDPLLGFHWTPRGHMMVDYSVRHYLNK